MSSTSDVAKSYDRWAASYDEDKNATRDLDAIVIRRATLALDGRDVLELGSGTGKNTMWLATHAKSVIALDFSLGMIARAHERVGSTNVKFLQHDVRETFPLPAASVDLVVANLILEHVHDLEPVFFEAARVLRPGGQMFVCELHPYRQLTGAQAQFKDPSTGQIVMVTAHVHSISEYVNGAIRAGFSVREIGEALEDDAPAATPPRLISMLLDAPGVDAK